MALPKGVKLSQTSPLSWQVSWSAQHPATRWAVTYTPPGKTDPVFIGIIESTRTGARGHNRHAWWARTPAAVNAGEPTSLPGAYVRQNRAEAARALVTAWRVSR